MLRKVLVLVLVSYLYAYNIELDWSYVLRNPDIKSQEREAYFGYTVALITTTSSSWALVGAPRANDTQVTWSGVMERGAVYLCQLPASSSLCRQLIVTNAANGSEGGSGNFMYETMQDYGWLGGSLDLLPEEPDSVIVTCSPRWTNQMYSYDDYFMNGACYLTSINDITSSGSATRPWRIITPLVDIEHQRIYDENGVVVYYNQLGQAGLSAHVPKDNQQVWLGAPGVNQWTGSMIKVTKSSGMGGAGNWTYTNSKTFEPAAVSVWSDYFGYSVGSGRFFGSQTHMVSGSPRHQLVGKVSLFSTNNNSIQVRWEKTGPQIGSYFGAAVATGDVNADGWSELFVGAPLFSVGTYTESGLVVIYSRKTNLDNLDEDGRLIGSRQAWARFGSAIMVVGDLDRDGYNDLAVGAPYEAGGSGAVYIYRGSATGLLTTASQKIVAKDVSSNLKGFGISISRGTDIDGNGYADFAVGAHEGIGSAVVLRTRPVMKFHLTISSKYEILTEIGITFNVTPCVSYNGFNILDETAMNFSGLVDDGSVPPRAVFLDTGTGQTTFKTAVKRGHDNCHSFPLKIQDAFEDYERPLQVSFEAELAYDDPGCEKCGVTSPESNLKSRISLPLALGCGADGVCRPELELSVTWQGASQLALRSESTVTLSIVVSVAGKEASYIGVMELLLPDGLTSHQPLPYSCSQTGKKVSCKLPNPMTVGEKEVFEISVEESGDHLVEGEVPLKVICSASGTHDVEKTIALSVIEDVKLELSVHSEDDMIEYSPPPAPPAATTFTYQIINRGDTRVNEVKLDILIPTAYNNLTFAQITQQPALSSECSLHASSPGAAPENDVSDPPHKVLVKVVCGKHSLLTCNRVICTVRQVHLAPLIKMEVAYNTTIFTEKISNAEPIAIYTSVSAAYGSPNTAVYTESGIWTTLTPKGWLPPAQSTPAWAYVVAVVVGLLILAAVVMVLVKIGFFKRKRPLENSDDAKEYKEGQDEAEGEVTPFQDTEPEGEEATTTRAVVEVELYEDGNSF